MQTLKFNPDEDGYASVLTAAIAQLSLGKLVALPTETVYGLAADATNGEAVAAIFETKGRPQFNPLIAHVSGLEMAQEIGLFSEASLKLAKYFWPGPLTIVVEQNPISDVHNLVSAGLETIAIRCPSGGVRQLIEAYGKPLAAPSANLSGHVSPTNADHVVSEFGDGDILVLDGEECSIGIESTIVVVENERLTILRSGSISAEDLEQCCGLKTSYSDSEAKISAPGMMASHYAPRAKVILNCTQALPNSAMLGFGKCDDSTALNLSPNENLREAASNLYGFIRQLDETNIEHICVAPVPMTGLGIAINDRLSRAAAPRPATKEDT